MIPCTDFALALDDELPIPADHEAAALTARVLEHDSHGGRPQALKDDLARDRLRRLHHRGHVERGRVRSAARSAEPATRRGAHRPRWLQQLRKLLLQLLDLAPGAPLIVEMPCCAEISLGGLAAARAEQMPRRQLVSHRLIATELVCVRGIHRLLVQAQGRFDATVKTRQLRLHEQLQMQEVCGAVRRPPSHALQVGTHPFARLRLAHRGPCQADTPPTSETQ